MASPGRFITIADFTPGIWGDRHAASAGHTTSDPELGGSIPQNGAARVNGTERCHADRNGSLIPLPKAIYDESVNDTQNLASSGEFMYLLAAQVGLAESFSGTAVSSYNDQLPGPVYTLWGGFDDDDLQYVRGRMYRKRIPGSNLRYFDFLMVQGTFDLDVTSLLPAGSFCNTRFYYGYTTPGLLEAGTDNSFRARWWYPVTVALVSSPFGMISNPQKHSIGTNATSFQPFVSPGPGIVSDEPYAYWSPSIGGAGNGGSVIAMNFNNGDTTNLPLPTSREDMWYFHYNDASHAHGEDLDEAINNPYMVVAHQQRIVMPDRRLSALIRTQYLSDVTTAEYRSIDDIVWYSDPALPMQDFDLSSPADTYSYDDDDVLGATNVGYESDYPPVIQSAYNKLTVGDDQFSQIGTLGVANYDQLLVIKHTGGGVVVSGDLDSPVIRRLPYIEPTGGVIVKGVQTPLGFVYGSPNGIFVWQGGEQTKKLSVQLDGFFWDHTNGATDEQYAGARGQFNYWNDLILVPNDFAFDVNTESWWKLGVADEVTSDTGITTATWVKNSNPCNIYETSGKYMFAFPYKSDTAEPDLMPVWYTYDPLVLDNAYSWQSHPLVETRGRSQTFHNLVIYATAHSDSNASIVVTLEGFDVAGGRRVSETVTFDMAASDDVQRLEKDFPNFTAEYVTIRIEANSNSGDTWDPNDGGFQSVPAPKIHNLSLGVSDATVSARHG